MNIVDRYYELYQKLNKMNLTKTDIAKYMDCSRNTLEKIINKDRIDINHRMEKLIEVDKKDCLNIEFLQQLDSFDNLSQDCINYLFENPNVNFKLYSDAFRYAFGYLQKSQNEQKGEDVNEIIKYMNIHMYNFHMRLNPYYLIMRGYFNKELRPIIDFNIDFDKKMVVDFQIKTISTAQYNLRKIRNNYKIDYYERIEEIAKNQNLSTRQKSVSQEFNIHFNNDFDLRCMTFNQFVELLYLFCIGYSNRNDLRFMAYEESNYNRFEYIKSQLKSKTHKMLIDRIHYYNLARFFNIDSKRYMPVEKILINYKYDKLADLEEKDYVDKLYKNVAFRISELEKLIVMVSGLKLDMQDCFEDILTNYDEEDGLLNDFSQRRITEIKNIISKK